MYAAGKKEIVTGSLDKTIVLWRLEVIVSSQPVSLWFTVITQKKHDEEPAFSDFTRFRK